MSTSFHDGRTYTVKQLHSSHHHFREISTVVPQKSKPGTGPYSLLELWDVRWRSKPFPWSYSREFKPGRRFFYHGTDVATIQKILNEGFRIRTAVHGRMLGDGIYATYHTNKGVLYGRDTYLISVMIYAPNTLCLHPGQSIDSNTINAASRRFDAIEVRSGVYISDSKWTMLNHEICVFDTRRIIPRFILKIG